MRNPYSHNKRCACGKHIQNNSKACDKCTRVGKTNPNYKDGRTLKTYYCPCGKKICYNSWAEGNKTCKSCAQRGEKSHNYVDGLSHNPYPSSWTPKLKVAIRKRDNYQCQLCGLSEEKHLSKYGLALDVHHIDYDKENCQQYNLICLCKPCHISTNHSRQHWKKLFVEQMKLKLKELLANVR